MSDLIVPAHDTVLQHNTSRLPLSATETVFRVRRIASYMCFAAAAFVIAIITRGVALEHLYLYVCGTYVLISTGIVGIDDKATHYGHPFETVVTIEQYLTSTLGVCKNMTQERNLLASYLCELLRTGHTRIRVTAQSVTNLRTGKTKEVILGPVFETASRPRAGGFKKLA